ncbi:MAG: DUF2142 domain-containing protein [Ardenticatenaceae bacterium]|nr:DUF2142 domain-containing protein [Ardenticatenaceae bacterium]
MAARSQSVQDPIVSNHDDSHAIRLVPSLSTSSGLFVLVVLAFVHFAAWSWITVPWQAPDEPEHVEVVLTRLQTGTLWGHVKRHRPIFDEILQSRKAHRFWDYIPWANPAAPPSGGLFYQPPLYYALQASVIGLVQPKTLEDKLQVMRLFSAALIAVAVGISFLTMRVLFPADLFLQWAVPLFMALHPMHAYLAGTVNNDALAELTATVGFLFLAITLKSGVRWQTTVGLLLVLGTAFYTKRTVAFLVPVVAFGLLLAAIRKSVKAYWLIAFSLLIGALGVALLLRSPLGATVEARIWGYVGFGKAAPLQAIMDALHRNDLYRYFNLTFRSFWGQFGWLVQSLDDSWYKTIQVVILLLLVGMGRWFLSPHPTYVSLMFLLFFTAIGLAAAQVVGAFIWYDIWAGRPGSVPQGRYLYPVFVPLTTILAAGFRGWFPSLSPRFSIILWGMGWFLFDGMVLFRYALPFFHG